MSEKERKSLEIDQEKKNESFFRDCPVTKKDNDKLGVLNYVNGLTAFIKTCDTPMTISIQGEWGSGKTSFMNMIKEELPKDNFNEDNLIFVNVWKYAQFCDEKNIARAVLSGVLSELKADKILKRNFRRIGKVFGSVIEIVTDATVGGKAGDAVGNLTKTVTDEPATTTLQKAINKSVDKCLKKSNKERIVFFIDDLDRLKPVQAIEVLEIIKNYLDIEKCVFVLAIDYDVIIEGVKEKYGNDFSNQKAHQFFEKIIQVPFKVPTQSYDITEYLDSFNKFNKVEIEIIKLLLEYSVGNNPRAIKRVLNILNLTKLINLSEKGISDEQYLAVICLQLCYNEIYDEMVRDSDKWQDAFNVKTENVVDERFIEKFIELFKSDKNNEKIEELLELTKVTDFETGKIKKEAYYVKLNIENQDTKILYFIKGGQMKSGIPALNYLLINSFKNELGDWYTTKICEQTTLKNLMEKGLNKYWLYERDENDNGKSFKSGYDTTILKELKEKLGKNLDNILFDNREDAGNSAGITISEEMWNYFINKN